MHQAESVSSSTPELKADAPASARTESVLSVHLWEISGTVAFVTASLFDNGLSMGERTINGVSSREFEKCRLRCLHDEIQNITRLLPGQVMDQMVFPDSESRSRRVFLIRGR